MPTGVDLLIQLAQAVEELQTEKAKDISVIRQGTVVIMPEHMSYHELIDWLRRKIHEEEQELQVNFPLPGYPLDAAVCFFKAIAKTYGWSQLQSTPGFWGPEPPSMISIATSYTEMMEVPWGGVEIPNIAGKLYTTLDPKVPRLLITGEVKKKSLPKVHELIEVAKDIWRSESIYRGQAIRVSWEWQRRQKPSFDFREDAPKFLNLGNVVESDLIFSEAIANQIEVGLFAPLEFTRAFRRDNIPIGRGVLLEGPYGVGKTLTANVTALKAINNNWTFIYLESVNDLWSGLKFAAEYGQSVVFCEDIDRTASGERNVQLDELLTILDGVESKGGAKDTITVFSTNHVEKLNKAILRPGRIDSVISLKPPDAEAAARLVKLYGRTLLNPLCDLSRVGDALKGKIPAMIREVVERAKIAAIVRTRGGEIEGQVSTEDLMVARASIEAHSDLLVEPKTELKLVNLMDMQVALDEN